MSDYRSVRKHYLNRRSESARATVAYLWMLQATGTVKRLEWTKLAYALGSSAVLDAAAVVGICVSEV